MAINETISTGNKYRRLKDATNKVWQRLSFWTKASDVEFDNGSTAEEALGSITGITDSVNSTSSNVAASAKAVSTLNSNLTSFQTGVDSLYDQISSLGVTPDGKTLAAITSAQQNLYNTAYSKGQTEATLDFGTDVQVWYCGCDQYGGSSGATSFSQNGKIYAITTAANSKQVYNNETATISVSLGGTVIASSSAGTGSGDSTGWGHDRSGWKDYTAGTSILVSGSGGGRWHTIAHVIFVKSN
jgi:hypothetical protein